MSNLLPEWLTQPFFYGRDPDSEEENSEDDGEEGSEDEDSDEGSNDEGEEGDDEGDEDEGEEEDAYEGLRTALTKERKLHRQEKRGRIKAERDLESARAQLAAGTNKESEAITELQTKLDAEFKRNSSLAKRFADSTLHTAIKEAAGQVGFIDPEDALSVASKIEVDQDDEDPTQVEVDTALILAEVKALAKRKPHLVNKDQKEPPAASGRSAKRTNTQRRTTKTSKSTKEKTLKERYPSLQ